MSIWFYDVSSESKAFLLKAVGGAHSMILNSACCDTSSLGDVPPPRGHDPEPGMQTEDGWNTKKARTSG